MVEVNPKYLQALQDYAERWVQLSKLELGTYKPRKSRRTTWNGMTPSKSSIKIKKRRAVASGKLQESIEYNVQVTPDAGIVEYILEDYGKYVESGRKAGKGVPVKALQKWIREDRKMRYFNRKTNKFEAMTESKLNSLSFMINRSIKAFGIDPNPFIEPSMQRAYDEHLPKIEAAYALDIEDKID